jgi:7-cyano-7-deazaguanine synthase
VSTLVLLSGGIDSTALLAQTVAEEGRGEVEAVSFNYGQRHLRELDAAMHVCDAYDVHHHIVELPVLSQAVSALTVGRDVPDGHYSEESMRATVVPGRNLIFIATAASIAEDRQLDRVRIAVHAGDHPIYPDCRPEFITAAAGAVRFGSDGRVDLHAPYVTMTKAQIIDRSPPDTPFELSWSCYKGGKTHCGRCGTCVERAEAFSLAGRPDPTTYADPDYWRQAVEAAG